MLASCPLPPPHAADLARRMPAALAVLSFVALILAWLNAGEPARPEILLGVAGICGLAGSGAALLGWGRALRRRLALCEQIVGGTDSRSGPEAFARHLVRSLRDHYSAEVCLLVFVLPRRPARVFRISAGESEAAELAADEADRLLAALPPGGADGTAADKGVAPLAGLLGCPARLSLALPGSPRLAGRVLIGRQRRFAGAELAGLSHCLDLAATLLENACLRELLAAESTERERQRIARDVHDSAIQPYIGLKFGLEALARKLRQQPEIAGEVHGLIAWVNREIGEMRRLVGGLRGECGAPQSSLLASLRRQTDRYGELFGIDVEVGAEGEAEVSGTLAREVLHMVNEGLSNVRRHSQARRASVQLRPDAGNLELRIANDLGSEAAALPPFVPRSLNERATALGGSLAVKVGDQGCTVVTIRIPMEA